MTTARDIVVRALLRLRIVAPGDSVPAQLASDGLAVLNDMLASWQASSIYVSNLDFVLTETFWLLVPPTEAAEDVVSALAFQGDWNASTNAPALASAVGTKGYGYRVSVAGSTTLDGLTPWAAGDTLIFDGTAWQRGLDSNRFHLGIIDLLAVQLAPLFGREPSAAVVKGAKDGWTAIQAAFIKPAQPVFDSALVYSPTRRLVPL